QYSVQISPSPPYQCIKTPVKIFVHQIDTFKSGRLIFTLKDCAGNTRMDTVCFTAHSPLPDLNAPHFWPNTAGADCHTRCTDWAVTDTTISNTSIDRGIDSIAVVSIAN